MEVTREGEARSGGGVASDGAAEASRLRAELAALKATCRELALRLATSKAQQAASSPGAVAALSRVLSAVAAGRALEDALRHEATTSWPQRRLHPALARLARRLGVPAAAHQPHPPLTLRAVPLAELFVVTGPSHLDVALALAGLRRADARHAEQQLPPRRADPKLVFAAQVLFQRPSAAQLPSGGLAAFTLPDGAPLRSLDLLSLPTRATPESPWPPVVVDALFGRHNRRRGRNSHVFVLAGSDADGSGSGDALARAQPGLLAAAAAGHPVEARTRYCVCLAAEEPVTLGTFLAGDLDSAVAPVFERYALVVPRVFCVVSRYPFFACHLAFLQAIADAWRVTAIARLQRLEGLGRFVLSPAPVPASLQASAPLLAHSTPPVPVLLPETWLSSLMGHGEQSRGHGQGHARRSSLFSLTEPTPPPPPLPPPPTPLLAPVRRGSEGPGLSLAQRHRDEALLSPGPPPKAQPDPVSETEMQAGAASMARCLAAAPVVDLVDGFLGAAVPDYGRALASEIAPFVRTSLSLPPAPLPFGHEDLLVAATRSSGAAEALTLNEVLAAAIDNVMGAAPLSQPPGPPPCTLGVELDSDEARFLSAQWAAPLLFGLLPLDCVLLLVGAALAEQKVVVVGGDLSLDCVTSCVLALATLLKPLSWCGPFLPVLPETLLDILASPTPILVGCTSLPAGFVQDEATIVVLLDSETVRIPTSASVEEDGLNISAGGLLPSFLECQLPHNSLLCHELLPLSKLLREAPPDAASPSPGSPFPAHLFRPSPQQQEAAARLVAAVSNYVRHLVHLALGAGLTTLQQRCLPPLAVSTSRQLLRVSDVERPFWSRFLHSQMLAQLHESASLRLLTRRDEEGDVEVDEEADLGAEATQQSESGPGECGGRRADASSWSSSGLDVSGVLERVTLGDGAASPTRTGPWRSSGLARAKAVVALRLGDATRT